jgi:hypothetical protein
MLFKINIFLIVTSVISFAVLYSYIYEMDRFDIENNITGQFSGQNYEIFLSLFLFCFGVITVLYFIFTTLFLYILRIKVSFNQVLYKKLFAYYIALQGAYCIIFNSYFIILCQSNGTRI